MILKNNKECEEMILANLEQIGDRIRKVRQAYRLTQQEMADQLHITRSCLANYELGKRQPPIELLNDIAKKFQISVDYLLCNTNSPLKEDFITEMLRSVRYISKDGKLDISTLNPINTIFAVEFINYLKITERLEKRSS